MAIQDIHQNFLWLHKNWLWFLLPGIIFLVLGTLAITLPVTTSILIEVVIGILLTISGAVTTVHAFYLREWKGLALSLLVGILQVVIGVLFLMYPLKGVITITFLLGVCLLLEGSIQMSWAFLMRPLQRWGWLFFNGFITLTLGTLILSLWPNDVWMLGFLVGVNFLVHGLALLMFAFTIGVVSETKISKI